MTQAPLGPNFDFTKDLFWHPKGTIVIQKRNQTSTSFVREILFSNGFTFDVEGPLLTYFCCRNGSIVLQNRSSFLKVLFFSKFFLRKLSCFGYWYISSQRHGFFYQTRLFLRNKKVFSKVEPFLKKFHFFFGIKYSFQPFCLSFFSKA